MTRTWAVTVSVEGNEVLTIESCCLSGAPNVDDYADEIRTCAKHLLSFIGDPPYSDPVSQADDAKRITEAVLSVLKAGGDHLAIYEAVKGALAQEASDCGAWLRWGLEEIVRCTEPRAGSGDRMICRIANEALISAGFPLGSAGIQKPKTSSLPSAHRGPTEPLQCLRCGTVDAFGPVSPEKK